MKKYPITHPQKRIIDSDLLIENTSLNNIAVTADYPKDSRSHLETIINYFIQTTPDINIQFSMDNNGEITQYYTQPKEYNLTEYDYLNHSPEEIQNLIDTLATQPFGPIFDKPLYRFASIETDNTTRLFVNIYHGIFDGSSLNLLLDHLDQLFTNQRQGKPLFQFQSNAMQYIEIEQSYLESDDSVIDRDFFIDSFKDLSHYPDKRNNTQSYEAGYYQVELTENLTSQLNHYCKNATQKITPFTFMLGLAGLYFARYNNSFGTIFSMGYHNRLYDHATNHSLGMYVSTVPVKIDYEKNMTFEELLFASKDSMKKSLSHSRYPFDDLISDLSAESAQKLLNIAIVSNATKDTVFPRKFEDIQTSIAGITLRINPLKSDTLGLQSFCFEYKKASYSDDEIKNMGRGMIALIEDFLEHKDKPCSDLRILSQNEERILLETFNKKPVIYDDSSQSIVEMFKHQVEQNPDNIAVVYKNSSYTYQEIDQLTDKIARHLIKSGVKKDGVVGVMIDRSEYLVIYPLAIQKAQATYMPLDHTFPSDRLDYMIRDAKVSMILSEGNKPSDHIPNFTGKILYTHELTDLDDNHSIELEFPLPASRFVILYTSGSTGKPKGCILETHSIVNFCKWFQRYYKVTPNDRSAAYASFGFDAHMMDIFPMITSGGGVCIVPSSIRLDFIELNRYYEENNVTLAFMTTQLGRQFVQAFDNKTLRALTIGGEKLPSITLPKYDLFHAYGPTECSIFTTTRKFKTENDCLLIGTPIDNYELFVLDKQLNLLPIGAIGELCVSGEGVSRGYLNRDDLTHEKFINWRGKRLYRTGDYVKWLPNGEIKFVGRIDGQVKLRGLRIELGEIEERLSHFSNIIACCVDVKELGGTEHLCAYYTASSEINVDALKIFLSEKLASFMIPTAYMQLDHLPLTANGKIDKKSLPQPSIKRDHLIVKPKNQLQEAIHQIICEIVGTDDFGVTDDLFTVGLTSLMAIKVAVILYKKLQLNIKTADIMRLKTIEAIEKETKIIEESNTPAYEKLNQYPLTQNQFGVYLQSQKDPTALQYNIPFELRFSTKVDSEKLKRTIESVITKHSYIHTYFIKEHGDVFQVRNDEIVTSIVLKTMDTIHYQIIKETFVQPFDLFSGPLFRFELFETPDGIYLLSDFHHIICDGGSIDLFLNDLSAAYKKNDISSEIFSSYDLSLEEKDSITSENYLQAKEYFLTTLQTEKMSQLPQDIHKTGSGMMKSCHVNLDHKEIDTYTKENGLTPNSIFMAGMAYTLSRYLREDILQFTTISNGRSDPKLYHTMGMLVKTLPICIAIDFESAVQDFITQTQATIFSSMTHEIYPFTKIAEEKKLSPSINFAYQAGVVETIKFENTPIELTQIGTQKPKFDLSIQINKNETTYEIKGEYNNHLYSQQLIQTFINSIAETIKNMIADPDAILNNLSLLDSSQEKTLKSYNRTQDDLDERIVSKRFEKIVNQFPNKVALIAHDQTLDFKTLNALSNRIANSLIQKGVRSEDKIGFLLPRDSRLHCALLGILKSGAAFIPIDPDYPINRINQILKESQAKFLITIPDQIKSSYPVPTLMIDQLLEYDNDHNPIVNILPNHLCYIIFTSGSTGKPKGVMIEQQGLSNYAAPIKHNTLINGLIENTTILLSITTVSFDVFIKENTLPLLNGIAIAFANEDQINSPNELAKFFIASKADGFSATPSRMGQYIDSLSFKKALKNVTFIVCGGEKYPPKLYTRLKEITDAKLYNTYGPTEITISSNVKELTSNHITVGSPLSNVTEFICDTSGNLLPIGIVGELYVGGLGVGRGYLNNPELTKKLFIDFHGQRIYKTGDYARWTPNGEIEILGRLDFQIKLRGLRIELGEIENAISIYPNIIQTIVTIKTIHEIEYLCAYYTADRSIDPKKLTNELEKDLTKYMIPSFFVQLDEFPMTKNGKIDLKSLPLPAQSINTNYIAPENDIEEKFCYAIKETLGLAQVGIDDNFFSLGGTSLLATKLTVEAENSGIQIGYADIFKYQTPRELAKFVNHSSTEIKKGGCRQPLIKNYDYTSIHYLLSHNTLEDIENYEDHEKSELGDILLTGATGYLGMHILKDFLTNHNGKIYCLVRSKKNLNPEQRLKTMLMFYFNDDYSALFESRIIPIEGEVTHPTVLDTLDQLSINTVINCAANVKHFAAGNEIEEVNVGGVLVLIDYCKKNHAKLIQISTHSIAGKSILNDPSKDTVLKETDLFMNQDLDNKYVNSKFLAERFILEAQTKGLKSKIMRVGNLMARNSDGEFQINFNSNAFMGRLKAYKLIGAFPYSALEQSIEFAPIDSTAKAILKLSETPDRFTVFHPYNNHTIFMADVIEAMNDYGFKIELVSDNEFKKRLKRCMNNDQLTPFLSGIIAYEDTEEDLEIAYLGSSQRFTTNILFRTHYKWPLTGERYLYKIIKAIDGLGFFNID